MKLARKQAEEVVTVVLDTLHDRLYEPWEWNDLASLPEGFSSWDQNGAVEAYFDILHENAVKKLLERK